MFLIILVFASAFSKAQEIKFVAEDTIKGEFDRFAVDNFGRIYTTSDDVIMLRSADLQLLFTGSLKSIRPSSIESSKSFRTLVFDQERSVIKFLDNTLTDIHDEIDLVLLGIQQPILVCESFGGNTIWILDADNMRLVRINERLETVLQTENLTNIFEGSDFPTKMKEVNDNLFVMVPGMGIAKFDVFGTFMDLYPCEPQTFDAMGNYLFVMQKDKLEIIPTDGLLEAEYIYDLPEGVQEFAYTRSQVYLQTETEILIGNFQKIE